jgi:ABC-type nitrate/sulfonate/bicarbonate transport system substrate-binding protein
MRTSAWLVSLLALCACSGEHARSTATNSDGLETLELRYQGFASLVTYPELAEDLGYLAPLRLKWIGNTISGPQDIQTVVTGDTDFGGAFNGAIVKLVAAKAPIRAVVGYYGVDEGTWAGFFTTSDSPITSARDLIGKKIAVNTLGAHHEFMLREYLARAGLPPAEAKQVTLVVMPPISSEQALRQHQVDVAVLNGIFRDKALERGGLRPLFTDLELFGKFTAGSYVFSERSLREHPKSVRKFVGAVARAIEWARAQPREVVQQRMAQIIHKRGRGEDASLVAYWKSTGIALPGGRIADREFQLWLDWLERDGALAPGQIALHTLFSNEFNPYPAPQTPPVEHASQ